MTDTHECQEVIGSPSRVGITHRCELAAGHAGQHLAHYSNGREVRW